MIKLTSNLKNFMSKTQSKQNQVKQCKIYQTIFIQSKCKVNIQMVNFNFQPKFDSVTFFSFDILVAIFCFCVVCNHLYMFKLVAFHRSVNQFTEITSSISPLINAFSVWWINAKNIAISITLKMIRIALCFQYYSLFLCAYCH